AEATRGVCLVGAAQGAAAAATVEPSGGGAYAIDRARKAAWPAPTWHAAPYVQMTRLYHAVKRGYFAVDSYSFSGPVLFNGSEYKKLSFDDLVKSPVMQTEQGGWLAAIQHHFLAAAVPPAADTVRYQAATLGQDFVLSALGSVQTVDAAMPLDYRVTLFVG